MYVMSYHIWFGGLGGAEGHIHNGMQGNISLVGMSKLIHAPMTTVVIKCLNLSTCE